MKKRLVVIAILLITTLLCLGCGEFEFGSDKFYLESINYGGGDSTWYYFKKKIDKDIIFERQSENETDGYEIKGQPDIMGFWWLSILDIETDPYISADFCCIYKVGMPADKLNIYFNYTVASTGERKEEVWEVDFGQTPYEDKRKN